VGDEQTPASRVQREVIETHRTTCQGRLRHLSQR
jgi:hypothetical protein